MATCGRHTCVERSVRMFLDQDYKNKTLFIFQNSVIPQRLDENVGYRDVILINRPLNLESNRYKSLGDIYRTALYFLNQEVELTDDDIITFWDDDDLFLPNHISAGVRGYKKGENARKLFGPRFIAYKPAKSYYRHMNGIELMSNTLEPSIFVKATHILEHGFSDTTTEQHLQWVDPLVRDQSIFVDPEGEPTLIYNWGDYDIPTYKTSGDCHNPDNFDNCRNYSSEHGDQIITPLSEKEIKKYYDLVK